MGDFIDKSGFNEEAHLFFTKYGTVESFPLPDGKRRMNFSKLNFCYHN